MTADTIKTIIFVYTSPKSLPNIYTDFSTAHKMRMYYKSLGYSVSTKVPTLDEAMDTVNALNNMPQARNDQDIIIKEQCAAKALELLQIITVAFAAA
jgi:hypothetical protein